MLLILAVFLKGSSVGLDIQNLPFTVTAINLFVLFVPRCIEHIFRPLNHIKSNLGVKKLTIKAH